MLSSADKGPNEVPPHLETLRLTHSEGGRIMAHVAGRTCPVRVNTCFPWSAPDSFISLRDDDNKEVALVADPQSLDADSQLVLEQGLKEARFAFEITHIEVMRLEFEIRHWKVTCNQGERSFQTRKDDWPKQLPPNGLLITDVGGDVYAIHDWTALDRHSRKQLDRYID